MPSLEILIQSILVATILTDTLLFLFVYTSKALGVLRILFLIQLVGIWFWAFSILLVLRFEYTAAAQLTFLTGLIIAVSRYYFILSFPEDALPSRKISYLPLLFAAFAFVLALMGTPLFDSFTIIDGYYIGIQNGPLASIYLLIVSYFLLYPLVLLVQKTFHKEYSLHIHEQLRYLLIGTAIFFIIGLVTNSILPAFFNIYFFSGLGPSFALVFAAFIIFIVTKHHSLGTKIIIQRSFIYLIISLIVIAAYITAFQLLTMFAGSADIVCYILSGIAVTLTSVFSAPLMEAYLRKKTDPFFFKDKYNYAEALYELSERVNKSLVAEEIIALTEESLAAILKSSEVKLTIIQDDIAENHSREPQISPNSTSLVLPILIDTTLTGLLTIEQKRSGDPYTAEDVVLLRTFAHTVASAIEKARLFKAVEDYSEELEHRVHERTAEIIGLQQRQTQMMLDIAHRLQTPLTIVKAELELLEKKWPVNGETYVFKQTIDEISLFVYDLLRLARLELIKEQDSFALFDMSTLVLELSEYFETILEAHAIELHTAILHNIALIGDSAKIRELIINLVSNADKYMGEPLPGKERRISISLTKSGNSVLLTVEDTGIGITADDLPYIFERFYRIADAESESIRGNGLGLTIVKRIVELHNGSISVSSTLGHGTIFTVRFPALF